MNCDNIELYQKIIESFNVNIVIVVESDKLYQEYVEYSKILKTFEIWNVQKLQGANAISTEIKKTMMVQKLDLFFKGPLSQDLRILLSFQQFRFFMYKRYN